MVRQCGVTKGLLRGRQICIRQMSMLAHLKFGSVVVMYMQDLAWFTLQMDMETIQFLDLKHIEIYGLF